MAAGVGVAEGESENSHVAALNAAPPLSDVHSLTLPSFVSPLWLHLSTNKHVSVYDKG